MPVRLRRTAVLVVVLTAVWLLPSPDDAAAVQHHHKVHNSSFAPAPDGCLAEAPHRCFAAQTHIRNPDSNDALDDVDDRDLGSDPKPTPSVDGDIASPRVAIAEGAHFRGSIDMQGGGAKSDSAKSDTAATDTKPSAVPAPSHMGSVPTAVAR